MRVVFMGTAGFGVPTLRILRDHHDIPAVVTRPDRPKGRGRTMQPSPVKSAARELGIPVLKQEKLSDPAFVARLKELEADLYVVVAFRILPREVFTIPPRGTVNLHASLLPDYRGAAPINWAVINGDGITGLTTFFIDEKVDTGDILLQAEVSIDPDETAGELAERMRTNGAELMLETVYGIGRGTVTPVAQPEKSPRPAPKLFKNDARIDWSSDAVSVHNRVRGTNPTPGAFTDWLRGPLRIHRTKVVDANTPGSPGLVTESSSHDGFVVSCGKGALRIIEVQPPGKKHMDSASFVRGYHIEPGTFITAG